MRNGDLTGLSILILEDEPLIALDIVWSLKQSGADVTTARDLSSALNLAGDADFSAAVIDYKISDADSSPLCSLLIERRIPFLIYTGNAVVQWQWQWPDVPVISKPASPCALIAAIAGLLSQKEIPHAESAQADQRRVL